VDGSDEANLFTVRIQDHLRPHAAAVKVAHPRMLRAIVVAKKKNDRIDTHKSLLFAARFSA
jgi:transposase